MYTAFLSRVWSRGRRSSADEGLLCGRKDKERRHETQELGLGF